MAALGEAVAEAARPTAKALALVGKAVLQRTPPKYLVGVSSVIEVAAEYSPTVTKALHEWRFAYWGKALYPSSTVSERLLKKKTDALKAELKAVANKAKGPVREELRKQIERLDIAVRWLPTKAATKFVPRPGSLLGKLEVELFTGRLAGKEAFDPLRQAFARWQEASAGFDLDELAAASTDLCAKLSVLSKKMPATKGLGSAADHIRAVKSATKALSRQIPTEDDLKMLALLPDVIRQLHQLPRVAGTKGRRFWWRHIQPAIEGSPNAWGRIGAAISSMKPVKASDKEAVKGLVTKLRFTLAEAIGTAAPAYRQALEEGFRRADHLAAVLNKQAVRDGVTPAWRAVKPHAALRAPGPSGKGAKLFVDDAILVVNDAVKPRKAYLIFAGQVKAGDASSLKAMKQLIADQQRMFSGKLRIGAIEYDMVPPPDVSWVQRAFVGTARPSGAGRLSGLVEHVDAPLDAEQLDKLAEAWLVKAGKITN